jgi:hypothetical protein
MVVTMAQTAMETCKAKGYRVSVTVIGNAGEVLIQLRGDGVGAAHHGEQPAEGLHGSLVRRAVGRCGAGGGPAKDPTSLSTQSVALPVHAALS